MDDDFRATVLLQGNKARGCFLALLATHSGVNFRHLPLKARLEEFIRFYELSQALDLSGVRCDNEDERSDLWRSCRPVISIQLHGYMVVMVNGIFEFDAFQFPLVY